ncbi:scarecrow-like protein 9 [Aegilops tauschii subsp. strangulata]|uniref:scarecrow-like protein 9 n=1 Tax=Aegilops tauschii subsp. strangulata TaxID=200361 RepID=UPI00098A0ABD|nr:scarecrow-like protein 9 [Aegilops tauschii subsp. strangulata]
MGSSAKHSSADFHSIMANTAGCGAPIESSTAEYNDSEFVLHPPTPMSYSPAVSIVSNKIGPQFHNVSCDDTSAGWRLISAAEHPKTDSDVTLSYIEHMLMQETDDKVRAPHGETAIRTVEEPFYELLGQKYPVLPDILSPCGCDRLKNLNGNVSRLNGKLCSNCSLYISSDDYHPNENSQASQAPWTLSAIVGEANKIPLGAERMEIGLNINGLSIAEKPSRDNHSPHMNEKETIKDASSEVRGRKVFPDKEDLDLLEGRRSKQTAIFSDEPIRNEAFDKVLLCCEHQLVVDEGIILQQTMANTSTKYALKDQGKKLATQTTRGITRRKKEVVDLRTLLIHCAEAVSVNNHSLASDILKTIRQHSSPSGDDTQRLAFYLAECLEIRLSGNGSQINQNFIATPRNAAYILKLFHLGLKVSPYLRSSYYFSNKTIIDVSKGKPKVHIIDFGICFGFQWPSLLKQFADREGGRPNLRITGIELPTPGFRPDEINNNTRLRLIEYADMFKVPFEYRQISSKWESITIKDLNIDKDELLVVNCIHRMKNLGDETTSINSARNRVLNNIRMMKPNIFIHGVVNGSYNTPFFLSRFKEVMYRYTSLFDMIDKTTPRDNETRMILERDIYKYEILNAIACEGSERIERPESYKIWKVRGLRARFEQLPLNPTIVDGIQHIVRQIYHKEVFVDEDDQFLVLGWKGRILYALSTWKPSEIDNEGTDDI